MSKFPLYKTPQIINAKDEERIARWLLSFIDADELTPEEDEAFARRIARARSVELLLAMADLYD